MASPLIEFLKRSPKAVAGWVSKNPFKATWAGAVPTVAVASYLGKEEPVKDADIPSESLTAYGYKNLNRPVPADLREDNPSEAATAYRRYRSGVEEYHKRRQDIQDKIDDPMTPDNIRQQASESLASLVQRGAPKPGAQAQQYIDWQQKMTDYKVRKEQGMLSPGEAPPKLKGADRDQTVPPTFENKIQGSVLAVRDAYKRAVGGRSYGGKEILQRNQQDIADATDEGLHRTVLTAAGAGAGGLGGGVLGYLMSRMYGADNASTVFNSLAGAGLGAAAGGVYGYIKSPEWRKSMMGKAGGMYKKGSSVTDALLGLLTSRAGTAAGMAVGGTEIGQDFNSFLEAQRDQAYAKNEPFIASRHRYTVPEDIRKNVRTAEMVGKGTDMLLALGAIAHGLGSNVKRKDIQEMNSTPSKSVLPGVGLSRYLRRARFSSEWAGKDQTSGALRALAPLLHPIIAAGAGATIGGIMDATDPNPPTKKIGVKEPMNNMARGALIGGLVGGGSQLLGGLFGSIDRMRTKKEEQALTGGEQVLKSLLIPGYGGYDAIQLQRRSDFVGKDKELEQLEDLLERSK